jgi:hypothetical protein
MDDLEALVIGRSFELIDLGVVDEGLTTAGESFGVDGVHVFLNFRPKIH